MLPALPSSSRASKHDDSDESAGELSSAGEQSSARCLSDSNRGEQLATPSISKKTGGKKKRAPSARYSTNRELPSWKSDPSKYDLVVLLALNPIKVYENIINSGIAETEYGRLPWLALSVLGGQTSNAFSEGCHSIAQLIMSDLRTCMGDDILQMIVCLRDGKEAVEQLKAIYPDEAKNVELDITAKLGELALQHRDSVQPQKHTAVAASSSDPSSSADDVESS